MTKKKAATPKKKKPQYQLLADQLTAGILSGKYPLKSILPSENELAATHGLSRHTAREAMRILEQQGLITRRRRAGSMVVNNQPPTRYNQNVQSVNDLLQYGNASRLHLLQSDEYVMDAQIAELLSSETGKPCIKLRGIRYQRHDNQPFAYSEIYLNVPSDAARKRLLNIEDALRYVTTKLDVPNLHIVKQTLTAENAGDKLAKTLDVKRGAATLRSLRTYVDSAENTIAVAYTWHAGHLFSYSTILTKV